MNARQRVSLVSMVLAASLTSVAWSDTARLPIAATEGSHPQLPPPHTSPLPTIHIAPAKGWRAGDKPSAPAGISVNAFAEGLSHPRWLYVLPDGDVLVAETDTPPKPEDSKGIEGKIYKTVQKRAGSGKNPSANRITLLRDTNGDGIADLRTVLISGLNSPVGMALVGNSLYVANTNAILRFPYERGQTRISAPGTKLVDLPGGPLNHHWTKTLIASPDGAKLYVGVGSNSNAAENGIAAEQDRAAVWEIDTATGQHHVFASGLRNPVGLAWEPKTHALWVSVNERDEIGSDVPPDYMTALKPGAFYGWPYSYFGQHVDDRVKPQRPDLVARAIVPDYALGPHTASLGLCAADGTSLPSEFQRGMFIGQHGSWNRKPFSGYKVVFVRFDDGKPSGMPMDVLTGFVDQHGDARGRPVGVVIDSRGDLLVADDVGNTVWRATGSNQPSRVTAR
ncbi:MAG: PQQ-dependent sugar dehydrogenase [Steroidobacteraceae bacterium]